MILFAGFTASLIFNLGNLMRHEVVEITPRAVSVGRQVRYPAEQIRTLRVVQAPWWSPLLGRSFWRRSWFSEWFREAGWNVYRVRRYALEMDSGKRIVRFGEGLNEDEAKYILGLIRKKHAS